MARSDCRRRGAAGMLRRICALVRAQRIRAGPAVVEKGLRGCEGQSIQIPLALAGSGRRRLSRVVRVAIMAATRESETAISVKSGPQRFRLERSEPAEEGSAPANNALVQLWPWTPEIALLRRGLWPVPRVAIEWRSRFGIWRLRQWFDSPAHLRIDADLRPGRREILRSPVYRALVAARQAPWTGHGREFERLREYQAGDNYAELAWKSTARRGVPVTRPIPVGAEAGSIFRGGPIAGFGVT